MYLYFSELKIGQKFTFIMWGVGEVEFEKITENYGKRSDGFFYKFNYNDAVKVIK